MLTVQGAVTAAKPVGAYDRFNQPGKIDGYYTPPRTASAHQQGPIPNQSVRLVPSHARRRRPSCGRRTGGG